MQSTNNNSTKYAKYARGSNQRHQQQATPIQQTHRCHLVVWSGVALNATACRKAASVSRLTGFPATCAIGVVCLVMFSAAAPQATTHNFEVGSGKWKVAASKPRIAVTMRWCGRGGVEWMVKVEVEVAINSSEVAYV